MGRGTRVARLLPTRYFRSLPSSLSGLIFASIYAATWAQDVYLRGGEHDGLKPVTGSEPMWQRAPRSPDHKLAHEVGASV